MKLLFDESLPPKPVELLRDLFPESESALRNGLARSGDPRILFWSTPAPAGLSWSRPTAILNNYPTEVARDVLRRSAIRVGQLPGSHDRLIILER